MRTEPTDLPPSLLAETLSRHWDLPALTLTHLPVGFGSHHWRAKAADGRGWFVTVDDHEHGHLGFGPETSFQELDRAMRTVATLRDAIGLEFVVSPLPDRDGNVLLRLDAPQDHNHYSVALFPLLDSERTGFGRVIPESQRQTTLRLIGRLHNATPSLPAGLPWRDDLAISQRRDLEAALNDLDASWTGGPYAEPARLLLREHRESITRALGHYDELAATVAADPAPWVVTHGEPHAGNVVRLRTGELNLVDWDTVALAPKERDLWMLTSDDGETDWTPYVETVGETAISDTALRLYRLRWDLTDIAAYVFWFRHPHEDSDDMRTGWQGLNGYLPLNRELFA